MVIARARRANSTKYLQGGIVSRDLPVRDSLWDRKSTISGARSSRLDEICGLTLLTTSPRTNIAPKSFCLHGLVPCFLNSAFRACDHTFSGTVTFTCTSMFTSANTNFTHSIPRRARIFSHIRLLPDLSPRYNLQHVPTLFVHQLRSGRIDRPTRTPYRRHSSSRGRVPVPIRPQSTPRPGSRRCNPSFSRATNHECVYYLNELRPRVVCGAHHGPTIDRG